MSGSRKSKRKLEFSNEETKKTKAVFTEEDDISVLKAMIDYEVSKQANPYDDMGKFLAFVQPFISFDVQRKQLTNRLWKLRNKYVHSDYDGILKPHHAMLIELSKSIKSWGCNADMSLDGDNVVKIKGKVVENKGKGKVVTCDVQQDNVAIGGDADVLNEGLKVGKKKRKHLSRDGQNVVSCDGQSVGGDKGVAGDIDVGKSSKVVGNKGKGKVIKNKGKGKVVNCDGRNVEQDNVEVNIKDLKGFTSMFPELTNMLELETLSKMPQYIKKKFVRDTIDFMGWEKANELEEEWVGVRLMEMELKAKKLELTSKQINLILEAMRTSM